MEFSFGTPNAQAPNANIVGINFYKAAGEEFALPIFPAMGDWQEP